MTYILIKSSYFIHYWKYIGYSSIVLMTIAGFVDRHKIKKVVTFQTRKRFLISGMYEISSNAIQVARDWTVTVHCSIYPTPPLGQDMTQGQFLSEV